LTTKDTKGRQGRPASSDPIWNVLRESEFAQGLKPQILLGYGRHG